MSCVERQAGCFVQPQNLPFRPSIKCILAPHAHCGTFRLLGNRLLNCRVGGTTWLCRQSASFGVRNLCCTMSPHFSHTDEYASSCCAPPRLSNISRNQLAPSIKSIGTVLAKSSASRERRRTRQETLFGLVGHDCSVEFPEGLGPAGLTQAPYRLHSTRVTFRHSSSEWHPPVVIAVGCLWHRIARHLSDAYPSWVI